MYKKTYAITTIYLFLNLDLNSSMIIIYHFVHPPTIKKQKLNPIFLSQRVFSLALRNVKTKQGDQSTRI